MSGNHVLAVILMATFVVIVAVTYVAAWKIFVKAGEPGWKSIIPLYGTVVILRIVGRSGWWALLWLASYVGFFVLLIVVGIGVAKSFARGRGFAAGLILLPSIFYCILAFGSATYVGPNGEPVAMGMAVDQGPEAW